MSLVEKLTSNSSRLKIKTPTINAKKLVRTPIDPRMHESKIMILM